MGIFSGKKDKISDLKAKRQAAEDRLETLQIKKQELLAQVLDIEDAGSDIAQGRKQLEAVKTELEVAGLRLEEINKQLRKEAEREHDRQLAEAPEKWEELMKERDAALIKGMNLIAEGLFIIKAHYKNDDLPFEFRFYEDPYGGGSLSLPEYLAATVRKAKSVFLAKQAQLERQEQAAMTFFGRYDEIWKLRAMGKELHFRKSAVRKLMHE